MIKFSKEKVLLLHKLIAEETGGSIGVRDEALLGSALENVFSGFGGQEFYPKMIVHQPLQRKEFDYDKENKTHHPHCGRRPALRGAGSGDRQPPCCGTHAH